MAAQSAQFIRLAAASSIALCALSGAASADGLLIFGTSQEGGGANAFERIIDFTTGHERATYVHGLASSQHGYDGQLWNFFNGAGTTIDMPSQVEDSRADMWIRQKAWRISGAAGEQHRKISLPDTSPITLTFDPQTRRVASAVFDGDYGPVTIGFSDWRPVGKYLFPFRQEFASNLAGDRTEFAQSVRLLPNVDPGLLKRPSATASIAHLDGGAVTVPFESVGQRKTHTRVTAFINGTPAEFIFDTGAANILTIDAAKRMQIASMGGVSVGGPGEGNDNGGYGMVDRVNIGGAALDHQSFIIVPSPFPPSNGKGPDTAGLLGYEFLAHFVTTIDYRAGTMTFRDAVPAGQKGVRISFVSDGHTIAVPAQVNGKPALVRFDTGDGGTLMLFPAYLEASKIDVGSGPVVVGGSGAGGEAKSRPGKIERFTLAGVDFPGLPVQFSAMSRGAFASHHLAANLGAQVIRCFRATVDYPHHQMWLELQLDTPGCIAAPPEPAPPA